MDSMIDLAFCLHIRLEVCSDEPGIDTTRRWTLPLLKLPRRMFLLGAVMYSTLPTLALNLRSLEVWAPIVALHEHFTDTSLHFTHFMMYQLLASFTAMSLVDVIVCVRHSFDLNWALDSILLRFTDCLVSENGLVKIVGSLNCVCLNRLAQWM